MKVSVATNKGAVEGKVTILKKQGLLKIKLKEPVAGIQEIYHDPHTDLNNVNCGIIFTKITPNEIELLADAGFEDLIEREGFDNPEKCICDSCKYQREKSGWKHYLDREENGKEKH